MAWGADHAATMVASVQPLERERLQRLHAGTALMSFLPTNPPDVIRAATRAKLTAFAMELIPRISRAQSMDALSSQALVAGYRAAIVAAERLPRFFPLNMTAAGTVPPAQVLVLGAGVAGLQAIATAKRLGACREGVRRPDGRRRGDRLDGRAADRARARHAGRAGRLRPRDDRRNAPSCSANCSRRTSPARTR